MNKGGKKSISSNLTDEASKFRFYNWTRTLMSSVCDVATKNVSLFCTSFSLLWSREPSWMKRRHSSFSLLLGTQCVSSHYPLSRLLGRRKIAQNEETILHSPALVSVVFSHVCCKKRSRSLSRGSDCWREKFIRSTVSLPLLPPVFSLSLHFSINHSHSIVFLFSTAIFIHSVIYSRKQWALLVHALSRRYDCFRQRARWGE